MTDINDVVNDLRKSPASMIGTPLEDYYWACQKAADLILRLQKQIEDLKGSESRFYEKRERNMTIFKRLKDGERNIDLAKEYGLSCPMVSKIAQRERDRLRKEGK